MDRKRIRGRQRTAPSTGSRSRTAARTAQRSPHAVLALQQVVGNQAVQRLLAGRERDLRGDAQEEETDVRGQTAAVQRDGECAASATGVSLGASASIKTATKYGLRTPIIVRGTNLADVLDSELVGTSIDHTGSMTSRPSANSNNSGFMAADNIPDDRHTSGIADHLSYFDDHGGDGSYARLQMDLYKIPSCDINDARPIPNSGYRIKREVKAEGSKVVGIVTKTAEAVTIGAHTSTAGLTAEKQAKVTLRE